MCALIHFYFSVGLIFLATQKFKYNFKSFSQPSPQSFPNTNTEAILVFKVIAEIINREIGQKFVENRLPNIFPIQTAKQFSFSNVLRKSLTDLLPRNTAKHNVLLHTTPFHIVHTSTKGAKIHSFASLFGKFRKINF